jgi:hypothetical protein
VLRWRRKVTAAVRAIPPALRSLLVVPLVMTGLTGTLVATALGGRGPAFAAGGRVRPSESGTTVDGAAGPEAAHDCVDSGSEPLAILSAYPTADWRPPTPERIGGAEGAAPGAAEGKGRGPAPG